MAADGLARSLPTRAYFASIQLGPTPVSTASGTSSCTACSMVRRVRSRTVSRASGAAFSTELVVHLQQQRAGRRRRRELVLQPDHGQLDDVGAGALDGGIGGGPQLLGLQAAAAGDLQVDLQRILAPQPAETRRIEVERAPAPRIVST